MNTQKHTWKIYFVRHGQTQNNLENRMNTWDDDNPLNETWIQQAKQAWINFKSTWVVLDVIISSSLSRAQETAKIIASEIWFTWTIEIDSRLREQDWWVFKWKKRDTILSENNLKDNFEFRRFFKDIKNNQIEDVLNFDGRVSAALADISKQHAGKNVLIVGHSGTSRPLLRNIQNLEFDFAHYEMKWLSNAVIIDLENYDSYK